MKGSHRIFIVQIIKDLNILNVMILASHDIFVAFIFLGKNLSNSFRKLIKFLERFNTEHVLVEQLPELSL